MRLSKTLRKFLKMALTVPLEIAFIRRRVAFELTQRWFSDLNLQIPLSEGFGCPIPDLDALYSFSEIFATGEYGSFLEEISLPKRWIDLGCHAGYFTLYLAWRRAATGEPEWEALLLDADPRMKGLTEKTLKINRIEQHCTLLWGSICSSSGAQRFALRAGMGSSLDLHFSGVRKVTRVPSVSPAAILESFPPPYDLIKIDIEGAEYDFAENYVEVHKHASAILIEWHARDRQGSGKERIHELLGSSGFRVVKTMRPVRLLYLDGDWYSSGVELYRRK
jgi:FkbM family methyltransferase